MYSLTYFCEPGNPYNGSFTVCGDPKSIRKLMALLMSTDDGEADSITIRDVRFGHVVTKIERVGGHLEFTFDERTGKGLARGPAHER